MTLVGAAVVPSAGQTWARAISSFESVTGRTMPVRRCYDGAPTSDIATSAARHDIGVRASVLSIKPSMTTPLATLTSLAKSIAKSGHPCDVIICHEPVDGMSGPAFIALYRRSAAPFLAAGVPVGVCFTNWSCNLPFANSQSALAHYWPGDDVVKFLAIDEYPTEIGSGKAALPMDQRTRRVTQFADARQIPLGIAEYGVDASWDVASSEQWIRSVTDWITERGRPLRWACYFSVAGVNAGGAKWNYTLSRPEHVSAYADSYKIIV